MSEYDRCLNSGYGYQKVSHIQKVLLPFVFTPVANVILIVFSRIAVSFYTECDYKHFGSHES